MSPGGTAFVRRALRFLERARARRYPTARWLAEEEEISLPTARRVIYRLRDDYGAPLLYSDAHRGWVLTTADWSFSAAGLASRRELVALAFAIDLGQAAADPELEDALETFWLRLAERLDTSRTGLDRLAIGPPGAQYFAGQVWHPAQQDTWDDDVLVRELPGHVSPELARRLLGLGPSLLAVEPAELREQVVEAARALIGNLD